jgi:AcrR family transcriptional regulator
MTEETPTRGEQTRSAIVQAAHDLFVQQGYHGTSMRQVAQQAGVALGGLYNHFASKEEVFEAVFFEYHPSRDVIPLILEAQGEDVETLIRSAAGRMVEVVRLRPDFLNLMFIEMVEFKNTHTQKLFSNLFPFSLQVVQRVTQAAGGRLRPLPPPMLVRSFLGLFFGYYMTELLFARSAPSEFGENAMQYFVEIYLHGILASSPAPSGGE